MTRCPTCDDEQGFHVMFFNWKTAHNRSTPEDRRRVNRIIFQQKLKFGASYQCAYCEQNWFLDEQGEIMHRVDQETQERLHVWSESKLDFDQEQIDVIRSIRATGADQYGNGRGHLHLPCCVTTRSGERFEKAMLLITKMPPIEYWRGPVFLGNSVLRIEESIYTLNHEVRLQALQADEMKSGLMPTLVVSQDGRYFDLHGSESFFDHEGLRGKDILLPPQSALDNIKIPTKAPVIAEDTSLIPAFYYDWFDGCESLLSFVR